MRPPFSGKPSPLGGPHYPLSIGEWLLPLISLGSDRGAATGQSTPDCEIARSLLRSGTPPYGSFQPPPLHDMKRKTRRLGVDVDCWSWEWSRSAFDGRGVWRQRMGCAERLDGLLPEIEWGGAAVRTVSEIRFQNSEFRILYGIWHPLDTAP